MEYLLDTDSVAEQVVPTRTESDPIPRPAGIFDPVARALDVIGERWTLVLVRQLLSGAKGFQELRVRTGIAPRVLSSRLRQLAAGGFVEPVAERGRSLYAVTERGRSLEPVIASIARWYIHHAVSELEVDTARFTETSAQSIMEALPSLLREDRAAGVTLTFEIRLTGQGGGVWTVFIEDGACRVALGLVDGRDAIKRGRMTKDGARDALDHYFHQVAKLQVGAKAESDPERKPT